MTTDTTRHLRPEEIAGYRQRTLEPSHLLEVDDHLARCVACREHFGGAERLGHTVRALRGSLASATEEVEHPTPEQLAAFVDGELDDVERELLEAHFEICPFCAEDADDLCAVGDALPSSAAAAAPSSAAAWLGYGALAALAAGLAGFFVWTGLRPAPPASRETSPEAAGIERPLVEPSASSTPGLPVLAAKDAEAVRIALAEGRFTLPPLIADLGGPPGTLMGSVADAPAFAPLRPLATAVETERPTFEWTPLPGATAYVVSVVDLELDPVVESPPLEVTAWLPDLPLERGRTYLWQVRASAADGDTVAPAPPAPEARFHVLSEAEAARLARLRDRYYDFHLVLGVLLAEAGALDEAERELERLVRASPGVAEPQRLLDGLRAQRAAISSRRR